MPNRFEVVYLTGAPASGKSSVVERLRRSVSPMTVFNYGGLLASHLERKTQAAISRESLRKQSATVVTWKDIEAVDSELLGKVEELRGRSHVIIDTHAVTKESFGFRVTPFSQDKLRELNPTRIVVLYTAPEVAVARIGQDSGGRRPVSLYEAGFHSGLQASVAVTYGILLGIPIYFLDGDRDLESIAEWFSYRMG